MPPETLTPMPQFAPDDNRERAESALTSMPQFGSDNDRERAAAPITPMPRLGDRERAAMAPEQLAQMPPFAQPDFNSHEMERVTRPVAMQREDNATRPVRKEDLAAMRPVQQREEINATRPIAMLENGVVRQTRPMSAVEYAAADLDEPHTGRRERRIISIQSAIHDVVEPNTDQVLAPPDMEPTDIASAKIVDLSTYTDVDALK